MKPMGDKVILRSKNRYTGRVSALRYESSYQCRHHWVRFAFNPSASSPRRARFSADGSFPSCSSSGKTAKAADGGQFELYKTSHQFDGTVANLNGSARNRTILPIFRATQRIYLRNRTACPSMQSGVCCVLDQFGHWTLRTTGIVIDFAGLAYSMRLMSA